ELRKTERGRRYLPDPGNFPVCDPRSKLRFTLDPRRSEIPGATACMEELVATGQARPTVFFDVWEIRLLESAPISPRKGNS
ncbi:MAG TPA: hypothetical protein VF911_03045, partial [Thermoanaerobaculia bacterium]